MGKTLRSEEWVRLLILEDRPEDADLAVLSMKKGGFSVDCVRVETEEDFRKELLVSDPDLIICDYSLPSYDGYSGLLLARSLAPEIPVVMFTGPQNEEIAAQCLRAGARDYVLKDKPARLPQAARAALEAREAERHANLAQRRLEESEERFRSLVETANDAILSFDMEGIVRFWNPAAVDTFDYLADEAVGQDIGSFLEDDEQNSLERWIKSVGADPGPDLPGMPLRLTGLREGGIRFPAEVSLSGWEADSGPMVTAIIRDTTARDAARMALETLSAEYELLLNTAGEGILGLDRDGHVTFANPVALDMVGLQADEFLGRNLHQLVHAAEGDQDQTEDGDCLVTESLRTGEPVRAEDVFFRKDGTPVPVALSSTPIRENDEVVGAVMILEDITARKDQEEALRASEAEYRELIENAPYGIYRSTFDGRFLSVNPALVEILGYSSEQELMQAGLPNLYADAGVRTGALAEASLHERFIGLETQWKKQDGTIIDVSLSGRKMGPIGERPEGFEVMVQDLTEKTNLEAQLRQAQKMEAVGQLTGGIAHDFNNVLAVVLLNSELMAISLEQGEAVELEDVLAIRDAAKRASGITKKLLGFSRRAELTLEPTLLNKVLEELQVMLRSLLPESIDVQVRIEPHLHDLVMADAGAVEQMILNLCTNARDAMPDGGRLTLRLTREMLDEAFCRLNSQFTPGAWMKLECEDTGSGMEPETLERIFDPFFTTKPPSSGTGLGLAMVYGLAKQQAGHVSAISEPGRGTTFQIFFPVITPETEEAASDSGWEGDLTGSETILVVEDDEHLRRAVALALGKHGYRVLLAADGEEGMKVYAEHHDSIDLVFSDLVLPKLDGMNFLERLQGEFGPARFVLASGYSSAETEANGSQPTGLPVVRKPWRLRDLLSTIRAVLESEPPGLLASVGENKKRTPFEVGT